MSSNLEICKVCKNRGFSKSEGIVCSLTSAKPNFVDQCEHYLVDEDQKKREGRFKEAYSNKEINRESATKALAGGVPMVIIGLFLIFFPVPSFVGLLGLLTLILGLVFSIYGLIRFIMINNEPVQKSSNSNNDDLEVI